MKRKVCNINYITILLFLHVAEKCQIDVLLHWIRLPMSVKLHMGNNVLIYNKRIVILKRIRCNLSTIRQHKIQYCNFDIIFDLVTKLHLFPGCCNWFHKLELQMLQLLSYYFCYLFAHKKLYVSLILTFNPQLCCSLHFFSNFTQSVSRD